MRTVVDASVVVKWFIPEAHSREARSLVEKPTVLVAPAFLLVEVAAVLVRKERRGEAQQHTASRAVAWLRAHDIQFLPDEELLDAAMLHAQAHGHPLYDCLYIAAVHHAANSLATFDKRLALVAMRCFVPSILVWEEEE